MKSKSLRALLLLVLALAAAAHAAHAAETPRAAFTRFLDEFPATKGKAAEGERLKTLFDRSWDYQLHEYPEFATNIGFPGQNGRWSDESFPAIAERDALAPKMVAALESIDRAALSEKDRLDYDLFLRGTREEVEGSRFHGEYLAINQMGGVQQNVPYILSTMPAGTVAEYEDILSRLRGVPTVVDQSMALLDKGLSLGITPPRITLRDVPDQVSNLLVDDPMKSTMLKAFTQYPDAIPAAERERLTREAVQAYTQQVAPAFRKLRDYLTKTYIPGSRESIGMSALPDGQAWYAYNARQTTTTDLTPQQIHEIGLSEVKRIHQEMVDLIASTGFKGSFADFLQFLRTDPRFFYDKPEDLVAGYRNICKRIDPELIKLFGKLPRLPYGVIPVPSYAEKSQTAAYYNDGSMDAGRPGYYNVNTYDLKSRPKWEMEALTLHESVPGHHLQISLAQELEGEPEWRKYNGYTAFIEGWALYAESLGGRIGLYEDPYSKFGQLTYEMWRAIRLVVDTGMHSMGWTREQAMDFFRQNAGKPEHEIVVEVDRYIVWPGQALAYKIGELKIQELRAYAEKELGPAFDIRAFHDEVLDSGALPLDILEARVKSWVGERKAAATARAAG
jgi:uncharacterized protein (DUF885 family)